LANEVRRAGPRIGCLAICLNSPTAERRNTREYSATKRETRSSSPERMFIEAWRERSDDAQ
jgi:hypothetical protein